MTFDCVIIGAGVSGMTAAIYLKRYGYNILLLEKSSPGGQINKTAKIENYPGYIDIDGPSLSMNLYEQIQKLNVEYQYGNVIDIIDEKDKKLVKTDNQTYETKTVIIASGREAKKLNIPLENELIGRGISYCATCDGPFFKDEVVCVVGGGNSALEESLYLSKICKKVIIINRSNKLRADKVFQTQIKSRDNIEIIYNQQVSSIVEKNNNLHKIVLDNNEEIECKGLFIYIGLISNISFLEQLNLSKIENFIKVNNKMETNIPGIYACGDVITKDLYQIVTATSEGAVAAHSIKQLLQ